MSKKIIIIDCEDSKAKTEKNFLSAFYSDRNNFLLANDNDANLKKLLDDNNLQINILPINHKLLKMKLDSNPQATTIIVFVDNDIDTVWKHVKETIEKVNKQRTNDKILFSHPSHNFPFEELISFFYEKPRSLYSIEQKNRNLKKEIGENYKGDADVYCKTMKKGKISHLKKNLNNFQTSCELKPLILIKDYLKE